MKLTIGNMGSYLVSLLKFFTRKSIMIDLQHSYNELEQTVLPLYELANPPTYIGETIKQTMPLFRKAIKEYNGNPTETFRLSIKAVLANQDDLLELVKKEFNEDIAKESLDYYHLNLLKYIEAITYFSDYLRRWNTAVTYETVMAKNKGLSIRSPTIEEDREFVNNISNIDSFIVACNMLVIPFSKYHASIIELKGHMYNENDWEGNNVSVALAVDPYRTNFIPVTWNPVYHIGLVINTWRIERYKRNQAELSRIQYMLLTLEDSVSQEMNEEKKTVLQEQINYYSNVANRLDAAIKRMEHI